MSGIHIGYSDRTHSQSVCSGRGFQPSVRPRQPVSHPTGVGFRSCANPEHDTTYMKCLERTHFYERGTAFGIASNLLRLQHFPNRQAAKRPKKAVGKRTHLGVHDAFLY